MNIDQYKISLKESTFSEKEENIIWDFYVSKSISGSSNQGRKVSDYNLRQLPYKEMMNIAGLGEESVKILLADNMKKTLQRMQLDPARDDFYIDQPKIACLTPYTISDEGSPKERYGKAESILRHIRNSLAHGNTYFLRDDMIFLIDKNRGKITASILIKTETLLDWIELIDHKSRYYDLSFRKNSRDLEGIDDE